jgi:hypothetical protein
MNKPAVRWCALITLLLAQILVSCGAAENNSGREKLVWPPVLNAPYPDVEMQTSTGKKVKMSSFKGKVILVEPIGMSCPACQAFVGGERKGGLNGVVPQGGLPSMDSMLMQQGISPQDPRLMRVHMLLYGPTLGAPTLQEAQAWAAHFDFGKRANEVVMFADSSFQNGGSFNMIPGFQLIDKEFILRSDSSGHSPRNNLYTELMPMLKRILN